MATGIKARASRNTKPAVPTDDLDDIEEDVVEEDEAVEEEAPKPRRRRKPAAKVVEEVDEDEDEEDEEDDEPVKKTRKTPAKSTVEEDGGHDTKWLTAHVNETLGTDHASNAIRIVLRKLAKDGQLDRTVGETRTRYEFTGPTDPIVKAVVAAVKGGAIKAERDASKLKDSKAAAPTKKTAPRRKPKAPVVDDDEELEDLDDE